MFFFTFFYIVILVIITNGIHNLKINTPTNQVIPTHTLCRKFLSTFLQYIRSEGLLGKWSFLVSVNSSSTVITTIEFGNN